MSPNVTTRAATIAPRLIALPGPGRGRRRRAALVALDGASRADFASALAHARRFDRRPLLIAVDGGLAACRAARRRPDLFVGDLDSTPASPAGVSSRIYAAAKDFSDFAGALEEAAARGADIVVVAGLIGGRLDHEWANVLEAGACAPQLTAVLAPSARGFVVITARGVRVATRTGALVSLFALRRTARVTLTGTAWTLAKRIVRPGSLGLSNTARGPVRLTVHAGVAALVFPSLLR
jgi:thiamine pyrophosphokinase